MNNAMSNSNQDGCQCKVCVLSHKVQAVQDKLSADDRAVIEQLLNEWTHESMEAGRSKSFLAGHGAKPIAVPVVTCNHEWTGAGETPAKWDCKCGTRVYRSYEDYCWD